MIKMPTFPKMRIDDGIVLRTSSGETGGSMTMVRIKTGAWVFDRN